MKLIITTLLALIAPLSGLFAGGPTRSVQNSIRYITFKDGQMVAIPEKYILEESISKGVCTLSLEGDTTFVYSVNNIESIQNNYNGGYAELKSFKFTHADNDQVYKDVEASIAEKGDTILVNANVPVIGKRLRPSFTLSEGASMWVDGVQQVSGQSSHRFTSPIIYTLAQPKQWIYQISEITGSGDENEDQEGSEEDKDQQGSNTEGWDLTQVDISMLASTNAPSNYSNEGLEYIWDNQTSTVFHSTWGSGSHQKLNWEDGGYWGDGVTEWPYIEIELAETIDNFCFSYTTSNRNNRFPQGWYITAYNSHTGTWDNISTLSLSEDNLPQDYLTKYTSPVYALGQEYSRIRVELTKASYKNYMVISEFALYSCTKAGNMARSAEKRIKKGFVPFGRPCKVDVKYLTDYATGEYKIPTIHITFGDGTSWNNNQWIGMYTFDEDGNYVWTKEEWIKNCTFRLDGAGIWPDINTVEGCEVRGRGNSSWTQSYKSKNPFRIKFPKKQKQSPFNLTKDRQWVFIANKQNGSMTTNSIAQKIAAMVDAEALCHMIPVDVYINGHYRGSYCFTEKIGIADNSVAIDETTGCLLELDDYYDETFKFKDDYYNLPVNVKDPDFSEEDDERLITFDNVIESFNSLTETLYSGGDITKHINMDTWAKFWLVNDLVRNVETHHPKSCYLFNEDPANGSLWEFGPVWDFDWAFGYEETRTYFIAGADEDIYSKFVYSAPKAGNSFYSAIRATEAGKRAYYKEWVNFMAEGRLQELCEYIDDYTQFALPSIQHNNDANVSEKNYTDYEAQAENSKKWIKTRANYIFNNLEKFDISPDIVQPEDYGQPTDIEDTKAFNRPVDVYTISGQLVRRQVPYMQSTNGLEPGIYIVGGKTTIVQ